MDASDVMCHICLGILIEPVTMPCNHRLCKDCLERSIEVNSLSCPMCKRRIGIWHRKNSKSLVDVPLWEEIRRKFPDMVALRLQGVEMTADELEELFPCVPTHMHASEGEISQEWKKELDLLRAEDERQRKKEEELSEELAKRVQEELDAEDATEARISSQEVSQVDDSMTTLPTGGPQVVGTSTSAGTSQGTFSLAGIANFSDEDLQQQRLAWEKFVQLKKDEELAMSLQAETMSSTPAKREKRLQTPKSKTRVSTAHHRQSTRKSPGVGKSLRQLSLKEALLKRDASD